MAVKRVTSLPQITQLSDATYLYAGTQDKDYTSSGAQMKGFVLDGLHDKIQSLTENTTPQDTDVVMVDNGTVTQKLTLENLLTLAEKQGNKKFIGKIDAFAYLSGIPENYLVCDGSEYLKSDFADLYAKIGDIYGDTTKGWVAPSDANHFRVPDYRAEMLKGLDPRTSGAVDPYFNENTTPRTIGSKQDDALQNITGTISDLMSTNSNTMGTLGGAFKSANLQNNNILTMFGADVANTTGDGLIFDASLVAKTSTETRPKNVAINYCIFAVV